jgi:hypothetical protein
LVQFFKIAKGKKMTKLLNTAFQEVERLNAMEQNFLANFILEEVNSEKKWDITLQDNEDLLAGMADIALNDFNNGKCEVLELNKL